MNFSIRVCRHCRKPVSLKSDRCEHCRKELMPHQRFLLVLVIMAFLTLTTFSFLFYGIFAYAQAKELLTCERDFYLRHTGTAADTCLGICTASCQEKGAGSGRGLLLSESYSTDRTSVSKSCSCSCNACIT